MKRVVAVACAVVTALVIAGIYFFSGYLKADTEAVKISSDNAVANNNTSNEKKLQTYTAEDEGVTHTYTNEQIAEYFRDVVFSSELDGYVGNVCKWLTPVKYVVYGERNEEDIALFDELMEYLNSIEGYPGISEAETPEEANFEIYYTTEAGMAELFENYVEGSWGMATFWWTTSGYEIVKARSAIVCDVTDQYEKNTVALEEITQAMGIGQDSYMYPESLYYQDWSQPQKIPYIDKCVIELLYSPLIAAGTSEEDAIEIVYDILAGESFEP